MGYTHHEAISATGTGGFAVGAKGSETRIITEDGDIYDGDGVIQNTAQGVITTTSTDGGTTWHVAPYACDVTAYVTASVSSGTGRTVSVVHGSAGDNVCSAAIGGASGTVGVVFTMTASAVPSLTALEPFRVVQTTCATAQVSGVTIVLTKT